MARPRKCTESTPRTLSAYAATSLAQRTHGEGLNSWTYRYANDAALVKRWIGCGIEIGVHLGGEWRHEEPSGRVHELARHEIIRTTCGERYAHATRGGAPRAGRGLQVGFVLFGERLAALEHRAGGALRFHADAGRADPELVDLAHAMSGGIVDDASLAHAVEAYVLRHAEVMPASALGRAKEELERWVFHDLPIPMVAEAGGTSATAFTRRFQATYGVTPATYRVMLRTNAAARLLWMRRELPLREVASACGFASPSYFFRTFRRAFGLTPAEARLRFLAA
jgi:AraC-like DNA-binding protein